MPTERGMLLLNELVLGLTADRPKASPSRTGRAPGSPASDGEAG